MFKVYDSQNGFYELISERNTLHEAFCDIEANVINQLCHQLDDMRNAGDPAVNNEQCKMLLIRAIRRRFCIQTEFLTLDHEDAQHYWMFDGINVPLNPAPAPAEAAPAYMAHNGRWQSVPRETQAE